jgi:hypothetical protein
VSKEVIDLHGLSHDDVVGELEDFLCLNDPPFEIITGNSLKMQEIVFGMLNKYNLDAYYQHHNNLGSILVVEKTK